jgi:sigma-54 dependent transcriptional regulator, acetoin dehydrogenase operon transcriptional activator AcoR
MDNSILFIVPNTKTVSTIDNVLQDMGVSHPVHYGSLQEALTLAQRMVADETKVVISFGLTAKFLQENLPVPVLEMIFSTVDFMNAIVEAQKYSTKILIIASGYLSYYAKKSLNLFKEDKIQIRFAELEFGRPIDMQVQKLLNNGDYDVVISGTPSVEFAQQHGKKGILFDIDPKMVEITLYNARSLAVFQSSREEKELLVQEIINLSPEGLIVTDEEGMITTLNRAAEKLINATKDSVLEQSAEKILFDKHVVNILDESMEFNIYNEHTYVLMNQIPIFLNDDYKGALISLRDAQEIRELGQKAQKRLLAKGYIARNTFKNILGISEVIGKVKNKAKTYAKHDSTVLILGETGVGKELFAQSIHNASRRKNQAFVAINCAAIPEELLESELFGYIKGAFTGASEHGKIGLFEAANLGTIFLDEISEIPLHMQTRLLRVIQERELVRIGDDTVRAVDVRVISASNRNLYQFVEKGLFREDLYYRLCVLDLKIPALRERKEDIEIIANDMIHKKNLKFSKNVKKIDDTMLRIFQTMEWPGNIRQLNNVIEKCVILARNNVITSDLIDDDYSVSKEVPKESHVIQIDTLRNMERKLILQTLDLVHGNKAACARRLGIDSSTLWRKLRQIDLEESNI